MPHNCSAGMEDVHHTGQNNDTDTLQKWAITLLKFHATLHKVITGVIPQQQGLDRDVHQPIAETNTSDGLNSQI